MICVCVRARRLFASFNRLKLGAPLAEASLVTASSLANLPTLLQVLMRSTATRWNLLKYRFRTPYVREFFLDLMAKIVAGIGNWVIP